MKILFIGDVFGKPGRNAVKTLLPDLRKKRKLDLVIANIENINHGKGVSPNKLEEMKKAGVDFFTSGNHIWKDKDIYPYLNKKDTLLLRPLNYLDDAPGHGDGVAVLKDERKILIINVSGQLFMPGIVNDPFRSVEKILIKRGILKKESDPDTYSKNDNVIGIKKAGYDAVFIDIHGEATGEKLAFGYFMDGKVSAVIGTHTHVQTADEQIFPQGTAYLSDVGLNGPMNSVIGISPHIIVKHQLMGVPIKHDVAPEPWIFQAVLIEVDDKTGYALSIKRIQKINNN